MAPSIVGTGDFIVLFGGSTPYVLREDTVNTGGYGFVGDWYSSAFAENDDYH